MEDVGLTLTIVFGSLLAACATLAAHNHWSGKEEPPEVSAPRAAEELGWIVVFCLAVVLTAAYDIVFTDEPDDPF